MNLNPFINPMQARFSPSKKLIVLLLAAGIAFVGTVNAFAQQGSSAAPAANASQLSKADQNFLISAAQGGATEIAASNIALGKSTSNDVKTFAQQMVTDHTKVANDLKSLAASKNFTLPDGPSSRQQSMIDKLNADDPKKFDRQYASEIGVSAHRDTVAAFKKAAASARDPDIKAFAQANLPTLQHHLDMAENLKKAVSKM